MSTINYTYNVIVDRFRQFAAGHFQLRRFTHGEISQADLEKEAEWPWLHVKPRAINYSPGTRSFQFEIFISDLPRDKEDKTGYQAESITDCSLIFQDLINEIYLGNMFGTDVVLTRPVNSEPFVEQYTHTLTGVTGTIELNLDYDWSACSIPASWNYNTPTDSPSDGWGALQFIESLDQNGVFVSLLNDEEAPGNSYYYGTNSSGVKGWYAIVDNVGLTCETLPDCATIISIVDDIAALQSDKVDKIAGKGLSTEDYTTAEKSKLAGIQAGAEVNVNADWNAVSGDAQILNKPTIPSIAGLVPDTRTITINGTTQDLSANRTFSVGTFNLPALTSGSVLFSNGTTIAQDNANLFWDDTNNRLGVGTNAPATTLQVGGTITSQGIIPVADSAHNLGTAALRYNVVYLRSLNTTGNSLDLNAGNINLNNDVGAIRARLIGATGNFLIGSTTDAGFRLDVNGSVRATGSISASSAIARGTFLNQTLVATANNDVLVGLDITPTFTTGAFTGVTAYGLYVRSNIATTPNTSINVGLGSTGSTSEFVIFSGGRSYIGFDSSLGGAVIGAVSTRTISFGLGNSGSTTVHGRFHATTGNFTLQSGGTFTDIASARLAVNSTTQGFLPPRMTTTQKNAIASPATGLMVYDTTLNLISVYNGTTWITL